MRNYVSRLRNKINAAPKHHGTGDFAAYGVFVCLLPVYIVSRNRFSKRILPWPTRVTPKF